MAFNHKRSIKIDYTKTGSTDSTNFPVLVSGTYAYLKTTANGGFVTNSTGYDVGFYSDFGLTSKLNWEVEKYTATTGEVVYWVQVPTVKSTAGGNTTDTIIYMAYGNTSITTDQSNATGTWDSNYKGVWHLPDGTTLTANDSTSNTNHYSSLNSTSAIAGQMDGGASLNGSSNYIAINVQGTTLDAASDFTLSAWVYQTSQSADRNFILEKRTSGDFPNYWLCTMSTGRPEVGLYDTGYRYTDTGSAISANAWHHIVGVYDKTGLGQLRLYVDGSAAGTPLSNSGTPYTNSTSLHIGKSPSAGQERYFAGRLDEVRVSAGIARSASWIMAEYNNQSAPDKAVSGASGFYTISGELSLGGTMGMMGVG